MLRTDRGGIGQNERGSTELSVCSRGETTFSLYKQHGKFSVKVDKIMAVHWVEGD
jgi:hypothetical protein